MTRSYLTSGWGTPAWPSQVTHAVLGTSSGHRACISPSAHRLELFDLTKWQLSPGLMASWLVDLGPGY